MAITPTELTNRAFEISKRFSKVNTFYLKMMAKQIKDIGKLDKDNLHRLEQLALMGNNIKEINSMLVKETGLALEDIQKLYIECAGEEYKDTAMREVYEETGVKATLMKYIGKSQYSFTVPEDVVEKTVHWYLMMADSYYSKPQREEYFVDSGYYKYHEAYHLLKFPNEKQMLERAYEEYQELKKNNLWGSHRYE